MLINKIKKMCTPAQIYLAISLFSILILIIHNLGNNFKYSCIKTIHTKQPCVYYFLIKLLYIIFWTWLLQYLCSKGYVNISWGILLYPYIMMIVLALSFVFIFHKSMNKLPSILKK